MHSTFMTLIHMVAYLWTRWQRKGRRTTQMRCATVFRHFFRKMTLQRPV